MVTAIIGSRNFSDYTFLQSMLNRHIITSVVSGRAKGADKLAARYANENGLPLVEYLPEYDKYGQRAPLVRNHLIVNEAELLIAFWDGQSSGTRYTIDLAKKKGIGVMIYNV